MCSLDKINYCQNINLYKKWIKKLIYTFHHLIFNNLIIHKFDTIFSIFMIIFVILNSHVILSTHFSSSILHH